MCACVDKQLDLHEVWHFDPLRPSLPYVNTLSI